MGVKYLRKATGDSEEEILRMTYVDFNDTIEFYADPETFQNRIKTSKDSIETKRQAIKDAKRKGEERAKKGVRKKKHHGIGKSKVKRQRISGMRQNNP